MCAKNIKSLRIKFNNVYYFAKQERPFADLPDLITLNKN